jgi:hypothetical protein
LKTRALVVGVILGAAAVAAAAQTPSKPAPNVTGKWTLTLETEAFTANPTLELKQDAEKLTGSYTGRYGAFPLTGKIKDRALEFSFKMNAEGMEVVMAFAGEVAADGQTMKGKATLGEMGDATWTAKREK